MENYQVYDGVHAAPTGNSTPTTFTSVETVFIGDDEHHSGMVSGILAGMMALNNFLIEGNNLMASEANTAAMLSQMQSAFSDQEMKVLEQDNENLQNYLNTHKNPSSEVVSGYTTKYQVDSQYWQNILTQSQANTDLMNGTVQNGPTSQKTEIDEFQSLITIWQISEQAIA